MLGTLGIAALALVGLKNYMESESGRGYSDRKADSTLHFDESIRQENERGWEGEETKNRVRVTKSQVQAPLRTNTHRIPGAQVNRPMTNDEVRDVRLRLADALDEIYRLPGHDPLNMNSKEPYARQARGLGAHHPGLTRFEYGNGGMPVAPMPYRQQRYAEMLELQYRRSH